MQSLMPETLKRRIEKLEKEVATLKRELDPDYVVTEEDIRAVRQAQRDLAMGRARRLV
jgi:hypothetical protein